MSFSDIFCQDKAIDILQRAFASGRASHAYIFAGPEGVGKYTTACEWAKLLLCHDPVIEQGLTESCGQCCSCRLFEAGSHPDFNHIYKELREFTEEGSGKAPPVELPIDVIREFLIAKVSIRPSVSHKKVFVISEAEKLNVSSQNSLLKVLEEPPIYSCIVLLCTRLDKLLPTTRSRSQIIRFGLISEDRIIERLKEMNLDDTRSQYFARLAQGSMGAACQWARLELADANLYQTKKDLIKNLADFEFSDVLDLAGELLDESKHITGVWADLEKTTSKSDLSRKAAQTIVRMVISALYDVMKLNVTPIEKAVNFDQKQYMEKLACRFGRDVCAEKISDCYDTLGWIESSVNERLIWEHLLLSLANSDTM